MRTTISGFEGARESVRVRVGADMKSGRALVLFLGAVVLAGLPGCLRLVLWLGGSDDSDTTASKNAAETAISREVAELAKLYRMCLQKNEDNPVKAKENCGPYKDAIRDLAPDNTRTIVAEVLDQLRDKHKKPSNQRDIEP